MDRVRVGVVGTGGIFRGAHLKAYAEIPELRLTALCDVSKTSLDAAIQQMKAVYGQRIAKATEEKDGDTAERLKADLENVKVVRDYTKMLQATKPDLVDICTSPDFHTPVAIAALRAGCHAMCEKPMARTWLECVDVVEAAEKTGKFYQHNENWLYDPPWYTARKLIDSGAIGEVQVVFLATAHGGPEMGPGFWNPMVSGGGSLLDNGIHAITASWFTVGMDKKPVRVKAAEPYGLTIRMPRRLLSGVYSDVEVEDDGHILIHFENEAKGSWATAHVEGSWSHRDSLDTMIVGTNGVMKFVTVEGTPYAEIADAFGHTRQVAVSGPTWAFYPSSFYGEIRSMCLSVLRNAKPFCDERIGAESSAIVGAAYLSQARGKIGVEVEEFKAFAEGIRKEHGEKAPGVLIRTCLEGIGR